MVITAPQDDGSAVYILVRGGRKKDGRFAPSFFLPPRTFCYTIRCHPEERSDEVGNRDEGSSILTIIQLHSASDHNIALFVLYAVIFNINNHEYV